MKYILNENMKSKLLDKYLSNYEWRVWDTFGDGEFNVYVNDENDEKIFYLREYPTSDDIIEYTLHIQWEFYDNVITGMFGETVSPWDIVRWFNKEFNTECVTFSFFHKDE